LDFTHFIFSRWCFKGSKQLESLCCFFGFVINELAKIDKIFAYGSSELVQAKASLGSDLTNEDIILHHQGFQIMRDLFNEGKITKDSSTDEINAIVRKVINETFNLSKPIISLEDE